MRVTGAPDELDGPLPAGARVGTVEVRVARARSSRACRSSPRRAVEEAGLSTRLAALLGASRSPCCWSPLLAGLYCAARAAAPARRPESRAERGVIITVTLNAAIDKTLSVPNFRLGRRHRTVEQTTMAGGKGVNVARALKTLGQPVIATGFAGGPTGTRIVEQLTEESILNDFVRIREESRTNTAVLDPTTRRADRDQRARPGGRAEGARALPRQARLPRARRGDRRVRRARCRAAWTPTSTRCSSASCASSA